jgi:PKD repeat protein
MNARPLLHIRLLLTALLLSVAIGASAQSCSAAFTSSVSPGTRNVLFTNTSTGTGLLYSWTFGDGTSTTSANPTHTYTNPGWYLVCLSVSSADSSCYDQRCDTIMVNGTPSWDTLCIASFNYFTDTLSNQVYFNNTSHASSGAHYLWTFGDGTSSTLANPTHNYTNPGWYLVCLRVFSADSSCYDKRCDTIMVNGTPSWDTLCHASFNYFTDTLSNQVHFNNTSHASAGAHYLWTFGDGTSSTSPNPAHNYANPGWYLVCLNVSSADSSCYDQHCDTIMINGTPSWDTLCHASFTYFIDTLANEVYFNNTSHASAGAHYEWTFGDGTSSTSPNPTHNYTNPGWYLVCLNVSSPRFCFDQRCDTIMIKGTSSWDTLCHASFTYFIDTLANEVYFNNTSHASAGAHYEWTFGDGTSSTSPNPAHNYANPGWYLVCLNVSSPRFCFDQRCDTIFVPGQYSGDTLCQADFTYYTDSISGTVHFINLSSASANPQYRWNFGDGYFSSVQSPSHQYALAGWYRVCLYINTPDSLCYSKYCDSVYVSGSQLQCNATFSFSTDSLTPNTVAFSSGTAGPATYWWYFGDGSFVKGTDATPVHTYPAPGTYRVLHIVAKEDCWDSLSTDIYVSGMGVTGLATIAQPEITNVYPLPFDRTLHLDIVAPAASTGRAIIMDITGKTVAQQDIRLQQDHNTLTMSTDDLARGMYVIKIVTEYGESVQKIVK